MTSSSDPPGVSVGEKPRRFVPRFHWELLACGDEQPKQYHDAAHTPQVAAAIDELARLYNERRVTVITLIFTKPTDPLRSFADAFKFRRRDPASSSRSASRTRTRAAYSGPRSAPG